MLKILGGPLDSKDFAVLFWGVEMRPNTLSSVLIGTLTLMTLQHEALLF